MQKDPVYSQTLGIPVQALEDLLAHCQNDFDVWSVALLNGLTTLRKPETDAEAAFQEEEMSILEDVQEAGLDRSTLYQKRRTL